MNEEKLIQKLRLIEALYSGAKTEGEKEAAGRARERILDKLISLASTEPPVEYRFALRDQWNRRVFVALARRYGLQPYRYKGQRYTTVMIRAPRSFIDETLWPEYQEISQTLHSYLNEVTDRVISEVIHDDTSEATVAEEAVGLAPSAADGKAAPKAPPPPPSSAGTGTASSTPSSPPDRGRPSPAKSGKISRNAPCPCDSGKKYKKCCGRKQKRGR